MNGRSRRLWSSSRSLALAGLLAGATALLAAPDSAEALSPVELRTPVLDALRGFCGFYVAGADAKLFNDATVVVLMRDGTRTVLSMQNAYQGPPEDFALVIPVPVVLQEGDVKTLKPELFDRIDKLAAPRLVEYWEVDPCAEDVWGGLGMVGTGRGGGGQGYGSIGIGNTKTVKVEAQFDVAEYEIVILSATESTGLDSWLRESGYEIPEGAEPLLRPYVQDGMKFFVAKVDPKKVKFDSEGRAVLAPLRFHYDSKEFALPIRLGLINAPDPTSGGKQDLLVHILAPKTRYQAANYENVTIPTNLDLQESSKDRFGEFYVSLFDHTLAQHPKAVVTEYAWAAGSCDPCPGTPLSSKELIELGGDVLPEWSKKLAADGSEPHPFGLGAGDEFVLTRLHARYDSSSLGEDLVFEAAPAIVGGREWPTDEQGNREQGAKPAREGELNSFQARYAIRHPWTGKIECKEPKRGRWGGPPEGEINPGPTLARQLAQVARGGTLGSFVTAGAGTQLGVTALEAPPTPEPGPDAQPKSAPVQPPPDDAKQAHAKQAPKAPAGGCACNVGESSSPWLTILGLCGLLALRRRSKGNQP
jgi:MYXO-CTERM domain-containing protein